MISDLFIQLLEKLFELLKLVRSQELDRFDELIQSILKDMLDIHRDYLDNLTRVREYIRRVEIDKAIEFLEVERVELRPLRTAMQALVGQLVLNEKLGKYQKLLNAMGNYLDPRSSRSAMFEIISILSSVKAKQSLQGKNYTRQIPDLMEDIEYVITELESSWENVLQEYNRVYGTSYTVKT
jgi:hypothetical protein